MPRQRIRRRRRVAGLYREYELGPFVGMRDSLDPTSTNERLARMLRNTYPLEPHHFSRVIGRPGFAQIGAQLGGGGDVQFIGQFTKLDGTEYTIAIVGGRFYTLNWGTSTWTEVVTAANFSTASITVSSSARFYAATFADTIIFNDGANQPWTWDGTTGAGGLVPLTNAPAACFGPPTIHYGKVFWIDDSDRATFVWSEEGTANTGYTSGGYNNAWTLRQTDQNALVRLLGANEALYIFRERSITEILGEVTQNFASTGTREAISETIGTRAPGAVFFDGRKVFFPDADGRPHVLLPGTEPVSIWEDFHETLKGMDSTKFDEIEGYWHPNLELGFFAYEEDGKTERSRQLGYHSTGGEIPQAACVFDGYTFTRIGVVKNADGDPRVLHGSTDGYLYEHGIPDGTVWSDGFNSGDLPIRHEVWSPFVSHNPSMQQYFDRADFLFLVRSDITMSLRSESNADLGETLALQLDGAVALWDVATWDVATWGGIAIQHGAVGLHQFGPFCGVRVVHESGTERFGVIAGRLRGRPLNTYAGMA